MVELQQLVIKNLEETKEMKLRVNTRMKMLNNISNKREKKVRSVITAD
jgi:hypothetical protein